jgi:hypothetical protein
LRIVVQLIFSRDFTLMCAAGAVHSSGVVQKQVVALLLCTLQEELH